MDEYGREKFGSRARVSLKNPNLGENSEILAGAKEVKISDEAISEPKKSSA